MYPVNPPPPPPKKCEKIQEALNTSILKLLFIEFMDPHLQHHFNHKINKFEIEVLILQVEWEIIVDLEMW